MRSIALIGRSGSGKTSISRGLNSICGTELISTGKICRQIAALLFGDEAKSSTQRLDDALTAIDPSIFLKAALRDVPQDHLICVDSLRFKADLDVARSRGMLLVRVVAADELRKARLALRGQAYNPEIDGFHRSETELDNVVVDHTIMNNGSTQDLDGAIKQLLQKL